jgi:hypothetical protein
MSGLNFEYISCASQTESQLLKGLDHEMDIYLRHLQKNTYFWTLETTQNTPLTDTSWRIFLHPVRGGYWTLDKDASVSILINAHPKILLKIYSL